MKLHQLLINTDDNTPTTDTTSKEADEYMNKILQLKIGNTIVDACWMVNDSVDELKKLAKDGLTISMYKYSTFEQAWLLPNSIKSSDTYITTTPSDIVLYSSNQIVILYGANTWDYTKIVHINITKN